MSCPNHQLTSYGEVEAFLQETLSVCVEGALLPVRFQRKYVGEYLLATTTAMALLQTDFPEHRVNSFMTRIILAHAVLWFST